MKAYFLAVIRLLEHAACGQHIAEERMLVTVMWQNLLMGIKTIGRLVLGTCTTMKRTMNFMLKPVTVILEPIENTGFGTSLFRFN